MTDDALVERMARVPPVVEGPCNAENPGAGRSCALPRGHSGTHNDYYSPAPVPSVVTTVEELEALPAGTRFEDADGHLGRINDSEDKYSRIDLDGWAGSARMPTLPITILVPVTVLTPTSPPPSEVRVTGEQMAALRAIAEAGPFIDGEMGYCLTCQFRERSREDYNAGPEKHDPDCVWAVAHRAAGIPVAGEES